MGKSLQPSEEGPTRRIAQEQSPDSIETDPASDRVSIVERIVSGITPRRPSGTTMSVVASPADALRDNDIRRTRIFIVTISVLNILILFAMPLFGGHPRAEAYHSFGLALCIAVGLGVLWHIRDPSRFRPIHSTIHGLAACVALGTGYYFWGPHSVVVLVALIGILFYGLGQSFGGAMLIYVCAVVPHLVLSPLMATGVIVDVGLVRPTDRTMWEQLAIAGLVQYMLASSFVMARALRRWQSLALDELDEATREVAQREARFELERAMAMGGAGRFSEQQIGSFRLGAVIGRGGMGEVYRGRSEAGQLAAVKVVNLKTMGDPTLMRRFLREIHLLAKVESRYVVRLIETPDPAEPIPYLAMELLSGDTLADILRARRRMATTEVIDLVTQVGEGLQAVHDAGIVHRDLKPRNVLLDFGPPPTWKLLDFGMSVLVESDGSLTQGAIVGTPTYMAPEQANGGEISSQTDNYCLGLLAYRALTGRPPVSGRTIPAMLHSVVFERPPRPSNLVELPPSFDWVFARALSKTPEHRFRSAGDLAQAMREAANFDVSSETRAAAKQSLRRDPWPD